MSADPIRFRHARIADIPALVELVTSSYRGDASRAGWTTEADILDGNRIAPEVLRADIERERSVVLLAEAADGEANRARPASERSTPDRSGTDDRLLACAHVCVDDGVGYFGMFAVRPRLQGGGLGRRVLAEAERIARAEFGVAVLRMTVIDCRDELIAWYERRGYRRTGIHKPFPYGDERFGIPRRPDLRFELLEKGLVKGAAVDG